MKVAYKQQWTQKLEEIPKKKKRKWKLIETEGYVVTQYSRKCRATKFKRAD